MESIKLDKSSAFNRFSKNKVEIDLQLIYASIFGLIIYLWPLLLLFLVPVFYNIILNSCKYHNSDISLINKLLQQSSNIIEKLHLPFQDKCYIEPTLTIIILIAILFFLSDIIASIIYQYSKLKLKITTHIKDSMTSSKLIIRSYNGGEFLLKILFAYIISYRIINLVINSSLITKNKIYNIEPSKEFITILSLSLTFTIIKILTTSYKNLKIKKLEKKEGKTIYF